MWRLLGAVARLLVKMCTAALTRFSIIQQVCMSAVDTAIVVVREPVLVRSLFEICPAFATAIVSGVLLLGLSSLAFGIYRGYNRQCIGS